MARRRLSGCIAIALCAGGLGACKDKTTSGDAPKAQAKPQASAAVSATPSEAKVVPPSAPLVSEEAARTLLGQWEKAQNTGDFDAYSKLYAERFTGVKRAAERKTTFNRKTWLEDRKSMFAHPFEVKVSELKVQPGEAVTVVVFEQAWSSARYGDRGKKQIVLGPGAAGPVIVREEMLSSSVDEAAAKQQPVSFERFAFARKTQRGTALVLPDAPKAEWAAGDPVYLSNERAQRAVNLDKMPASYRAYLDKEYELFDAEGRRCSAKPRAFLTLVDVVPHFGTINVWEGREGDTPVPWTQAARAKDLWDMSDPEIRGTSQGRTLAIEMELRGACKDPFWGREAKPDQPKPLARQLADAQETAALVDALTRSPGFAKLNADYRKAAAEVLGDDVKDWMSRVHTKRALTFTSERGAELAVVQLLSDAGQCIEPGPDSVVGILRKSGNEWQVLDLVQSLTAPIDLALDVTGDGAPEFASPDTLLGRSAAGFERLRTFDVLFLDCPC